MLACILSPIFFCKIEEARLSGTPLSTILFFKRCSSISFIMDRIKTINASTTKIDATILKVYLYISGSCKDFYPYCALTEIDRIIDAERIFTFFICISCIDVT